MPPSNLRSAVEALLFSSDQPLTLALLSDALESPAEEVTAALESLGVEYTARAAGVELRQIAGGWVFMTAPEQNEWVTRMLRGKRKMRLSRAALETMAIIAYKQPVTKSEVEAIRGVDASGVLATLLERNLVTIKGRSTVVGRPLLYGTTGEFLNYFGLSDLSELPRPEELRALVAAREPEQLEMMELDPTSGMPLALAAGSAVLDDANVAAAGDPADEAQLGEPDSVALGAPATTDADEEQEDRFSIADADAAIAAANAARGEAVLAMATDFTGHGSDGFVVDDDEAGEDDDEFDEDAEGDDDDEFEGDEDDDEFDDAYDDDDDEDGDEEDDDDMPSASLSDRDSEGA
ncbi:MAG: SMC-Scp complex subunit ScpB [Candidatus Eisenbacteria bacterium]|nr:SMC-Scp complex subunit ScpB [Candidatus Eisenbacteria bacterium]